MLVLTRQPGQQIDIGEGITITLIEISGKQARIGIDAPKDLKIFRRELVGTEPPDPKTAEIEKAWAQRSRS